MFRKITFAVVGLFFLGWVIFEIRKASRNQKGNEPILTEEEKQAIASVDYTQVDFSHLQNLDFSNFNFGNFGAIT